MSVSVAPVDVPASAKKRAAVDDAPIEHKKLKETTTTQECAKFPFTYAYVVTQHGAEHDVMRFRLVPDIVSSVELAKKWMNELTAKAEHGKKDRYGWKRKTEKKVPFFSGECVAQYRGKYYKTEDAIDLDDDLCLDDTFVSVFRIELGRDVECL